MSSSFPQGLPDKTVGVHGECRVSFIDPVCETNAHERSFLTLADIPGKKQRAAFRLLLKYKYASVHDFYTGREIFLFPVGDISQPS